MQCWYGRADYIAFDSPDTENRMSAREELNPDIERLVSATREVLVPDDHDSTPHVLDHVFDARRIAVVGASDTPGKWSNDLFRLLSESFKGDLIPVNTRTDHVERKQAYSSISSIPLEVDLVLVVVPRDSVVNVVRECVDNRIPVVHVLSSGFGEVGGHGSELQRLLVDTVAGSGTALIGPNSLGIHCARTGMTFTAGCRLEAGPLTFVSQSGGLCYDVLVRGQARGLKFGKVISVGNCADLDWPDYVRYFSADPDTEALALYIESVSDGLHLYQELREAAKRKPVFVLKGGKTRCGSESVASHTGRMAGEYDIWQAMIRQAGCREVLSIDDLLIAMEATPYAETVPAGHQAGHRFGTVLIGTGGGATVLLTDECEEAGVSLAPISEETRNVFIRNVPDAETLGGVDNPVEIGVDRLFADPALLARLTEVSCRDANVDAVIIHLNLTAIANLADPLDALQRMCDHLRQIERNGRNVSVVLRNGDTADTSDHLRRHTWNLLHGQAGLSVFNRFDEALSLIRHIETCVRDNESKEDS